jgi:hypothetical protein
MQIKVKKKHRKLGKDYRKKKKLFRLKKDARKRFRTSRK